MAVDAFDLGWVCGLLVWVGRFGFLWVVVLFAGVGLGFAELGFVVGLICCRVCWRFGGLGLYFLVFLLADWGSVGTCVGLVCCCGGFVCFLGLRICCGFVVNLLVFG